MSRYSPLTLFFAMSNTSSRSSSLPRSTQDMPMIGIVAATAITAATVADAPDVNGAIATDTAIAAPVADAALLTMFTVCFSSSISFSYSSSAMQRCLSSRFLFWDLVQQQPHTAICNWAKKNALPL